MAVRYVKDFEFPSAAGYSQSSPSKVTGQMLAKGGAAKAPKGPGLMVMIGIPKRPMKKADGGGVDSAGMSQMAGDAAALQDATNTMTPRSTMTPQQRQKLLMLQAAKRRAMMQQAQQNAQDTRMNDVPPGASYDQGQMQRAEQGYKKGGKVAKVMHEFGEGKLHSGSKKGPKVTNPKQAIAIALSEQRASKKFRGGLQSEDGSPLKSVPVKDIKSGKVPQSTDEDYYGKEKPAPMPPRRPSMLKKGGMPHEDVAADKSLIKSMVKPGALKKADGGPIPPQMRSPLQDMARARFVPVAPRAPMIPQQAAPAGGGPRIGVNAPRPGGPNVGAIRAAMARKASQAMPENAPGLMKKGGKVNC